MKDIELAQQLALQYIATNSNASSPEEYYKEYEKAFKQFQAIISSNNTNNWGAMVI